MIVSIEKLKCLNVYAVEVDGLSGFGKTPREAYRAAWRKFRAQKYGVLCWAMINPTHLNGEEKAEIVRLREKIVQLHKEIARLEECVPVARRTPNFAMAA